MDISGSVKKIAEDALAASRRLARSSTDIKNAALLRMADELIRHRDLIVSENERDVRAAREKGLSSAMIDRLTVKDATLQAMAQGLREVAALPDPVGRVTSMWRRPN
ncbi:gamma-glutamyl phosphate reductase, partial [Smithella sp. F21]